MSGTTEFGSVIGCELCRNSFNRGTGDSHKCSHCGAMWMHFEKEKETPKEYKPHRHPKRGRKGQKKNF